MPELAAFTMASTARVVMSPRHKRRRGSAGEAVVSASVAMPASAMSPCSSSSWAARNSAGAGQGGRTFTSDRKASHSFSTAALVKPSRTTSAATGGKARPCNLFSSMRYSARYCSSSRLRASPRVSYCTAFFATFPTLWDSQFIPYSSLGGRHETRARLHQPS